MDLTPGIGVLVGRGVSVHDEVKVPLYCALSNMQLDSPAIFQFGSAVLGFGVVDGRGPWQTAKGAATEVLKVSGTVSRDESTRRAPGGRRPRADRGARAAAPAAPRPGPSRRPDGQGTELLAEPPLIDAKEVLAAKLPATD